MMGKSAISLTTRARTTGLTALPAAIPALQALAAGYRPAQDDLKAR